MYLLKFLWRAFKQHEGTVKQKKYQGAMNEKYLMHTPKCPKWKIYDELLFSNGQSEKSRTILTLLDGFISFFIIKMAIQKNQRKFFILSILMDEIYSGNIDKNFIERNDEFLSRFMIAMEWLCNIFCSVIDEFEFLKKDSIEITIN